MQKHAFFDLDGTLTDPFEGIRGCISYALQKLGEPVPDDVALRSWIGPPLYASFERHVGAERAALALVYYRERFGDTGWRENRVYDGIPSELHRLTEGGWQLFVATSKPTIFAERIIRHLSLI